MYGELDLRRGPLRTGTKETVVEIGSFTISISVEARERELINEISDLYADYPKHNIDKLPDFSIWLKYPNLWRKYFKRQIQAYVNQRGPYQAWPPSLGVPVLESSINWFLGTYITRFLLLHSAVLEREGFAMLLPGPSGAGKSTLSAVLAARGWRLLSDEVAMIRPTDTLLLPHPRPVSLKNASIDMIAERLPEAHFSKRYEGTTKGTVAFMRAPRNAVENALMPAKPALVVFLRYDPNRRAELKRLEKAHSFMGLVSCAANYLTLLETGFETLADMVETCDHYAMTYRSLDDAIAKIESIVPGTHEMAELERGH